MTVPQLVRLVCYKHTADLDFTQIVNTLNGGAGGSENGLVKTLGAMLQLAGRGRKSGAEERDLGRDRVQQGLRPDQHERVGP